MSRKHLYTHFTMNKTYIQTFNECDATQAKNLNCADLTTNLLIFKNVCSNFPGIENV